MEERTLIGTAICCVVIGIPLLFLFSYLADPGELQMKEKMIIGKVMNVRKGKVMTFYVEETRMIPVISFDQVKIGSGDVIEAEGNMKRGEFIADTIRIHHPS